MAGKLFVGTSGFAYREWKPDFYPADLKSADFLQYYASRLTSVEINYTFRRQPAEKTLAGWLDQTPPNFRFAVKAHQRITHMARLVDVDEPLERFLDSVRPLGDRLGPILFQCPPSLRYDPDVLDPFLARLPGGDVPGPRQFAMEFRHESWNSDEVRGKLSDAGVAWCVADTDGQDATPILTASFAYWRLRKLAYDDDALKRWAVEAAAALGEGRDVYAYFKHEDTASGALFAVWFREFVEAT